MKDEKPIALVTGATSGFGLATARLLLQNGYRVIVTGRRDKPLEDLKKEFGSDVFPSVFDIRDRKAVERAVSAFPNEWKNVSVLVNNAGLARGAAPIHQGKTADWDEMIDTNVKGLLYISRLIIPTMIKNQHGHIVNIGSIAGKETYPNGNVYCATKHAVQSITYAMRQELVEHNIRVSSICPGAAETEFSIVRYHGDEAKAKKVYNGFTPLSAEDVAETIWFVLSRPSHVNINDILIMPTAQANSRTFSRKP